MAHSKGPFLPWTADPFQTSYSFAPCFPADGKKASPSGMCLSHGRETREMQAPWDGSQRVCLKDSCITLTDLEIAQRKSHPQASCEWGRKEALHHKQEQWITGNNSKSVTCPQDCCDDQMRWKVKLLAEYQAHCMCSRNFISFSFPVWDLDSS